METLKNSNISKGRVLRLVRSLSALALALLFTLSAVPALAISSAGELIASDVRSAVLNSARGSVLEGETNYTASVSQDGEQPLVEPSSSDAAGARASAAEPSEAAEPVAAAEQGEQVAAAEPVADTAKRKARSELAEATEQPALTANEKPVLRAPASGTFGDNLTWEIDTAGNFTLRPTNGSSGRITRASGNSNYNSAAQWPWNSERSNIRTVTIRATVGSWGSTDLMYMFANCPNLYSVDLSGFDPTNFRSLRYMFADSFTASNITSTTFIGIGTGNKAKPNNLERMFSGCKKLKSVDVSWIDTTNVQEMQRMFSGCESLTEVDLSSWTNNGKVYNMQNMFTGCTSLEKLTFNNPGFKTRPVGNGGCQFANFFGQGTSQEPRCTALEYVDMSNITLTGRSDGANGVGAGSLTSTGGYGMFEDLTSLKTVILDGIQLPGMMNFREMFKGCTSLETLDLSPFGVMDSVINMDNLVQDCTSLTTLILNGVDNSNIGPTNSRHSISDTFESGFTAKDIGAKEYGRDLGLKTCTSLTTLSAVGAKVWMCKNNRGLPGNEYYNAANDVEILWWWYAGADGAIKNSGTQLRFDSDYCGTELTLNKREYIDLITDRDGTPANIPALDGPSVIADRGTNINIVNGDLNPHGAGFLAPGVYTVTQTPWDVSHAPMPDTYYRVAYLGEVPFRVEYNNQIIIDTESSSTPQKQNIGELWFVPGANNIYINTGKLAWPGSGDYTISDVTEDNPIVITYKDAAIDVNGKKHNVLIKITGITFTDLDRIPKQYVPPRDHDGNNYAYDSSGNPSYYRTVLQATKESGVILRNYVKISDPSATGDGTSALSGGSGTHIDFNVSIDKANDNTTFIFYVDDLDVAAKQEWNRPSNDACYDNLPISKVTYGANGEGFILNAGNDLGTVQFADATGLVLVDNKVLTTGSDPSTPWSEFTVKANARSGGHYTWTSGIACDTYALKNTPKLTTGAFDVTFEARKVLENGLLKSGDFSFNLVPGSGSPYLVESIWTYDASQSDVQTEGTTPPLPKQNNAEFVDAQFKPNGAHDKLTGGHSSAKIELGTLGFSNWKSGGNDLIFPNQGDSEYDEYKNAYFPGTSPNSNSQGEGRHNRITYTFWLYENIPSYQLQPHVLSYSNRTNTNPYIIKLVFSTPENDAEMAQGIKLEVYIDNVLAATQWSGSREATGKYTTDDSLLTFRNKMNTYSMKVEKEDVLVNGDSVDNGDTFDFTVTLGGINLPNGAQLPTGETVSNPGNQPNGGTATVNCTLGYKQTYTISGLPDGTTFSVTENAAAKYHVSSKVRMGGTVTDNANSGTISGGTTDGEVVAEVLFKNRTKSVKVTKYWQGSAANLPADLTVNFTLDGTQTSVSGAWTKTVTTNGATWETELFVPDPPNTTTTLPVSSVSEVQPSGYIMVGTPTVTINSTTGQPAATVELTNKRNAVSLSLEKLVTGNLGSKDQYFKFTITLEKLTPNAVYQLKGAAASVPATPYSGAHTNPQSVTALADGTVTFDVWLKHDDSITIEDLPIGTWYYIVEETSGYTSTTDILSGDFDTDDQGSGGPIPIGPHYDIQDTYLRLDTNIRFTNDKQTTITTGIILQYAAPIAGILLVAVLATVVIVSKRRGRDDDEDESDTDELEA